MLAMFARRLALPRHSFLLLGPRGTGKTTWLRHQLHAGGHADTCVIVNEAAETPIDDALLGKAAELHVLAGGCACCAGKAEMVALLRRLCDHRTQSSPARARLQRIVLETSGLAWRKIAEDKTYKLLFADKR